MWFRPLYSSYRTIATLRSSALCQLPDTVFLKGLTAQAVVGSDAWLRSAPQPVSVSIWARTSIAHAGRTDDVTYSLNYDALSQQIVADLVKTPFESVQHLASHVSETVLGFGTVSSAKIEVSLPYQLLHGLCVHEIDTCTCPEGLLHIRDLRVTALIGLNPVERLHKQTLVLDLQVPAVSADPRALADAAFEYTAKSSFGTVEALVTRLARDLGTRFHTSVTVSAAKPSALASTDLAGVSSSFDYTKDDAHDLSYIAFGSNIGDRALNIRRALSLVCSRVGRIVRTSRLYESEPMHVTDQPRFLNGVIAVRTDLEPLDLLAALKDIEYGPLGRQEGIRNGPRSMDLDIVLYKGDAVISEGEVLQVPHPRMMQRSFVLQPLLDVVASDSRHPVTGQSYAVALQDVLTQGHEQSSQLSPQLTPVVPLNASAALPLSHCYNMAIINVTPDSFSDGGKVTHENVYARAQTLVQQGADVLDIGGASTRPGAELPTEDQELARVIPAVSALSSLEVLLSVDTFRAEVAAQALAAGAHIINDISGASWDPRILQVVRDHGAPIVLMHSRGTPQTMGSMQSYTDVVEDVGRELEQAVDRALAVGVPAWQIILDPGLGFAKNGRQNLELLARFDELTHRPALKPYAWLVGASRKRFLGEILGGGSSQSGRDRDVATGAVTTLVASSGADFVRVHNASLTADVLAVTRAMNLQKRPPQCPASISA